MGDIMDLAMLNMEDMHATITMEVTLDMLTMVGMLAMEGNMVMLMVGRGKVT